MCRDVSNLRAIVCLGAALCFMAGSSQAQSENNNTVAYVYVASSTGNGSANVIQGYAANRRGRLKPVPGSPFNEDVNSMAVNGLYLMAADRTQPDINAYNIESNGSLSFAAQTNYAQYNDNQCGGAGAVFFDHTGQSLYAQVYNIDCANSGIASFAVDNSSGNLNYLGNTITGAEYNSGSPASFIGNNVYAYAAGPGGCFYYSIDSFERDSNGLLNIFFPQSQSAPWLPGPPDGFRAYVPDLAAADRTNHIAIAEIPANPPGCLGVPVSLASWTVDANGNLTTSSNYANMPTTAILNPTDMKMAPSGRLLALAGQEGLQVFHFNGAYPVTSYTPLLASDPINQMFWDNNHHLYAISQASGKLYVFTITQTGYREAPGSPYAIGSPQSIIVQPLPLPWQ